MGLFAQEENAVRMDAPSRISILRERGTSRLLFFVIGLIAVWWGYGFVRDKRLLSQKWTPLMSDGKGLTVVGTLDARESYDRNMFRIIQANKSSRAELTDFGWKTIFTDRDGELFSSAVGDLIMHIKNVDSLTGYAMLEPFIRVGVARTMNQPNASAMASNETEITLTPDPKNPNAPKSAKLGDLLTKYRDKVSAQREAADDSSGGGSMSGRETDHGIAIPGDTLARTCPVVLTGAHFTGADIEEKPASVLQGKLYNLTLFLTPEGRSRFYQWSRDHAKESLVFVVDGEVLTAARMAQTLDVNNWEIRNLPDKTAAEKLANYINQMAGKK